VKEEDTFRSVRTNDTTQHLRNVRSGIHYEIAECCPQFAMKIPIFTGLTNSLLIIFAVYSMLRWREDYLPVELEASFKASILHSFNNEIAFSAV